MEVVFTQNKDTILQFIYVIFKVIIYQFYNILYIVDKDITRDCKTDKAQVRTYLIFIEVTFPTKIPLLSRYISTRFFRIIPT
jgi:hypothetical protein